MRAPTRGGGSLSSSGSTRAPETGSGSDPEREAERPIERSQFVRRERAYGMRPENVLRDRLERVAAGHRSSAEAVLPVERELARDATDRSGDRCDRHGGPDGDRGRPGHEQHGTSPDRSWEPRPVDLSASHTRSAVRPRAEAEGTEPG